VGTVANIVQSLNARWQHQGAGGRHRARRVVSTADDDGFFRPVRTSSYRVDGGPQLEALTDA
jgi:hypothetical protein